MEVTTEVKSKMNTTKEAIGARIGALREKENLTQKQLAERIGSLQQVVQRVETGKYSVSFERVENLVNAMGYSIEFVKRE